MSGDRAYWPWSLWSTHDFILPWLEVWMVFEEAADDTIDFCLG